MRAKNVKTVNQGGDCGEAPRQAPIGGRQPARGRHAIAAMLATCLSLAAAGALAGTRTENLRHDWWVQHGTIKCGGNAFVRLGGTELHFVNYVFRNLSSKWPITVDRLVFYDATGALLYDSKISGFPHFANGVLGPGDQTLRPNQTGQLDVLGLIPFLQPWQRPMQLEVKWSARDRVPPLSVDLIRLVQQLDPVTQAQGAEKTRDSQDCDELGDLE